MEEPAIWERFKWADRLLIVGAWALSAAVLGAVLWRRELVRQILPVLAAGPLAGFLSHTLSELITGRWRQILGASLGCFFFLGIFTLSNPALIEAPEGIPFLDLLLLAGFILAQSLVLAIATTAALWMSERLLPGTGGARVLFIMISGAAGCAMIPWALGMAAGEPGPIWVFLTAYLGLNLAIARELAAPVEPQR